MDKGREHFDGIENDYERMIVSIVPSAEDFFGTVLSFVPQGKVKILELGSGTGLVTTMLVSENKGAEITCIDLSSGMLDVAKKKPELDGVKFIEGDFREIWGDGTFDVVLTTLCLHHLPDDDRKLILKQIYESLNPGGVFINGDVFAADSVMEEELNLEWWRGKMTDGGISPEDADLMLCKRRDNSAFLDTVTGYYGKMVSAGFEDVIFAYKNRIYGVFAGYKN